MIEEFEGKIEPNGDVKLTLKDDTDGEIFLGGCASVVILVFCSIVGLVTIVDYGMSYLKYILVNYNFYLGVSGILLINTLLAFNGHLVKKTGIIEVLICIPVYMVLGFNAYSFYGEWDTMVWIIKVCAFFGLVWLALFSSILTVSLCGAVAILCCRLSKGNISGDTNFQSISRHNKMTVESYKRCYSCIDDYIKYSAKDVWKCSFCGKWSPINSEYCTHCKTQHIKYNDIVKIKHD